MEAYPLYPLKTKLRSVNSVNSSWSNCGKDWAKSSYTTESKLRKQNRVGKGKQMTISLGWVIFLLVILFFTSCQKQPRFLSLYFQSSIEDRVRTDSWKFKS